MFTRLRRSIAASGLGVALLAGLLQVTAQPASADSTYTFNYTGSTQTWTVPSGVTSIGIDAQGAQGGREMGGLGGWAHGVFTVTPGQTLTIEVGGAGAAGDLGGYNGGGGSGSYGGGSGGGASDVRIGGTGISNRVIVGGGGGGAADNSSTLYGMGGVGGGTSGGAGGNGSGIHVGGGPGTQTTGRSDGVGWYVGCCGGSGAGGGGYYGGFAGDGDSANGTNAGGGGGSSYVAPAATNASLVSGTNIGNGKVVISTPPATVTPTGGVTNQASYSVTGARQYYRVPVGTTQIGAVAFGGSGYGGAKGGQAQGLVTVVPGQLVNIFPGGQGLVNTAGYNGGGGTGSYAGTGGEGRYGGGGSDLRVGGTLLSDRAIVAGGGGGSATSGPGAGGAGGGATGTAGSNGSGVWLGGQGGSQTAGGIDGGNGFSRPGTIGFGGNAGYQAGAGGGGYYGGGGGAGDSYNGSSGGGGGGSSYVGGASSSGSTTAGVNTGDGKVDIANGALPGSSLLTGGPLTNGEVRGGSNYAEGNVGLASGCIAKPIHTGTGNFWHTWSDIQIPGRGPAISLSRTYNSESASTDSLFGYGWSNTYGTNIAISGNTYTVNQENGSQVVFTKSGSTFSAPPRVNATLSESGGVLTFTRNQTEIIKFDSTGKLTSVADLNGYVTNITRPNSTTMVVTDPAGRALTFTLSSGRITGLTDPAGRTMSFSYDGSGNLTQVTQPDTGKWVYTYDGTHRMLTMREPKYFGDMTTTPTPVTTNVYDAQSRVTSQTDPLGRQTTLDYTSVPGATKMTDPKGNVCLDTYNSGIRTSNIKAYGSGTQSITTFAYDPATVGMTSVTDANNHTTTMTYDARGNRLTTTDALNHTTTVTYNGLNEPTSVVDALGNTTNMTYDAAGNLLTSTQVRSEPNPDVNETTTYTYDPAKAGDVTAITNPEGKITNFVYNTYGDVASVTDATNRKTTFTYNTPTSIGWVKTSVAPAGNATGGTPSQHTTTYEHDAMGRVTATKDPMWSSGTPNDHRITNVYDLNGNTTSSTDGKGLVTGYAYNADNELVTTTRPDTTTLVSSYWPDGSLKTQVDGRSKVTNYAYDNQGRLTSTTDPLSRITSYGYDAVGNLTTKTDPTTAVATYSYDNANRQTGINYSDPATPDVTYGYDNANRRTSMIDGTGTTTYSFDSLSRLTGTTNGAGQAISYTYDRANRQKTIVYPGSKTVTKYYDDAGRMTVVNDWIGNNAIYTYDNNGNLTNGDLGNTIDQITTYNNANQVTNNKYNPGWNVAEFVANRNGAGQVTSTQVWGDQWLTQGGTKTYSYDQVNRLGSLNGANATYDNGDNPTTLTGGQTQTFDNGNQMLTSSHNGGTTYTYDNKGNRTGSTPTATNALPVTYGYDQANRLKSASSNTSPAVAYDAAVAADSPRGYWRFNETSGNVLDSSGFNRTATTSGAVSRRVDGAVKGDPGNKAYQYSNGDAQIWIPTVYPNTTSGQDSTAEFYMRWDDVTNNPETVFAFGSGYGLSFNGGNFGFSTTNAATDIRGIAASGLRNRWVHVAAVFRNGDVTQSKLYIDGVLQTLTQRLGTPSTVSAANYATAGANGAGNNDWSGRIDELSIYNTALSQSRVTAHYNAGNSFTASYAYDGNGLRQSKTVGATTNQMLWDTSGGLPQLLTDGEYTFVYGPDGLPVSQFDSGGNIAWFGKDTQGNTRTLFPNHGASGARFDYDPYGQTNSWWGQRDTRLKFQGQYEDNETGFLYLRARYHDPKTNQFLTVDPLLPITRSAYGYANNDGMNYGDPSGMFTIPRTSVCIAIGDPSCDNSATQSWAGNVYAGIGNALTFGQGVDLAARAMGRGANFTKSCADPESGAYKGGELGGLAFGTLFGMRQGAALRSTGVSPSSIQNAMRGAGLQSQQQSVSLSRVESYVQMLKAGKTPPAIHVDGSMIVDGNHRYIAGRLVGNEPPAIEWLGGRPGSVVPWSRMRFDP